MSGQIGVQLNETSVSPGETISGRAGWQLEKEPKSVSIRLFWRTLGKGTEDVELVNEVVLERPGAQNLHDFCFELPVEPYSFDGRLVSVKWAVEAVAGKQSGSAEFVMAPDGVVCDLSLLSTGEDDEEFD